MLGANGDMLEVKAPQTGLKTLLISAFWLSDKCDVYTLKAFHGVLCAMTGMNQIIFMVLRV